MNLTLRRRALFFAALYLAAYLAWILSPYPQFRERFLVGNLAMVFTGLTATWLSLVTRQRVQNARLRSAWTLLSTGMGLWLIGDILRMLVETIRPSQVYSFNPLDLIYLIGSAMLLAGLLTYPRHIRERMGRLRLMLDATIATASVVTLTWLIILQPVIIAAQRGQGNRAAFLYPSADMLLLLVLMNLFLLNDSGPVPSPFGWMTAGLAAYTISDLAYAYLLLENSYHPGGMVNFGWTMGDLLMLLAIMAQLRGLEGSSAPSLQPTLVQRTVQRIQSLLPLVSTLVLGWYTLLIWQLQGQIQPLGLWMTVVLGLGLVARQGILAGEVEFKQYASLVNSIAEPTFICDRHGELRLVNPAMLTITGYNGSDDLLGLPLQQIIRPSQEVQRMIATGLNEGWAGEVQLFRIDGAPLPVMLALRPVRYGNSSRLSLAGTAHDLSETKRQQAALQLAYEQIASAHNELEKLNTQLEQKVAEKTLNLGEAYAQLERQNQALQNLDRLKSDFVSLVSHELRAPLTNISGGIELVLTRNRSLPEPTRETLQLVQAEILRLTRFVETILDLSALDAGRMPIYPAPLDLHSVEGILQRQMTHLPGTERVEWQIPAAMPYLLADERALSSVLFHLLDNALKYAPQGRIWVVAGAKDSQGWIRVLDQGEGVPAADLQLLFTRFFRSRASDAQTVYGHGLGLYIVQRLLEAMNGKIEVSNRPEGGACFTCWLPLAAGEETGDENEPEDLAG